MKLTTIAEINPEANIQVMESQLDYIAYTISAKIGEHLAEEAVKRMKDQIEKQLDNKFQVNIIVQKKGWLSRVFGL